jgi:hypothetical protein
LAARDNGVLLAVEQGARKVILESDNVTVNTLLRSDDGFRSAIAEVWQEIRELSLSFISFVCKHVNLDLRKKKMLTWKDMRLSICACACPRYLFR